MVYNFISSKAVIGKIFRDINLSDNTWVSDGLHWMGEAMEHMGTPMATEKKLLTSSVADHKVKLPSFLMELLGVGVHPSDVTKKPDSDNVIPLINVDSQFNKATFKDDDNSQFKGYFVNGGYIHTTFPTGFVVLIYNKVLLDEDGYPKIPDNIYVQKAIKHYIVARMVEGGLKHPAGLQYPDLEQLWERNLARARAQMKQMDKTQRQAFMATWTRLLPVEKTISQHAGSGKFGIITNH